MENVNLLVALGGGLASFLSPCIFPMVPVYFASLAGPEFLDPVNKQTVKHNTFFLHSLSFVLGFSLIFTLLGAIAGLTGTFIGPNSPVVRYGVGATFILLGIFMLAAAHFPQFNFERCLYFAVVRGGYLRSFLTGVVFTFAWTPCVSPILGSILTLSFASDTVWQGSGLLLVYSLGLGIPFLVIGLAAGSVLPTLRSLNRYTVWFYVFGDIALIAIGGMIFSGNLNLFSG